MYIQLCTSVKVFALCTYYIKCIIVVYKCYMHVCTVYLLFTDLPQQTMMLTGWVESLSLEDQRVLRENKFLNANHISTAHKLMVKAFPQ